MNVHDLNSRVLRFYVFLFLLAGPVMGMAQGLLLVPRGSVWKYHNLGQDLGSTWRQSAYNDSAWPGSGPGPLGDNNEAGNQLCASVLNIGPAGARYPVVYFRHSFTVPPGVSYESLTLRLNRDDRAVVYLNGTLLLNDGVPEPVTFIHTGGAAAAGAEETTYWATVVPGSALVTGNNVLAVEVHQQVPSSSDLQFDLEVEGFLDTVAPSVVAIDPEPGIALLDLPFVNVTFSERVLGVNASDLRLNGTPAGTVATNNPNDFTFTFSSAVTGLVQLAWAPSHGITDASPSANAFAGGTWTYQIDPHATKPILALTEFMADNEHGIQDDDGARSDWIELGNFGALAANLDGWFLTDDATNLTKWRLPGALLPANRYLLIWASGNNRTNPAAPLHTNFRLAKEGSYLALVDPATNVVSAFDPYPAQREDQSYGRDSAGSDAVGYFGTPTPGSANSSRGTGFAPEPVLSHATGIYTNNTLTLTMSAPGSTIRYTLDGSVPSATSRSYTGPITFGTNVTIKARVFSTTPGVFPSRVVSGSYVFLDSSTAGFNSNLPLLILCTEGRSIPQNVSSGGSRARGSLAVFDAVNGYSSLRSVPQFHGLAAFEVVGQTSPGFGVVNGVQSKIPYRIEIQDELGNDRKVALLGSPPEADWKLRNPYNDRTLLNDFLASELHGQMGHYALRPKLVEVFVDTGGGRLNYATDYAGVFTLFDSIGQGQDRVDIAELTPYATNEPAISGGWMIKYDKESYGDLNIGTFGGGGFAPLGVYDTRLKIHEPKPNQFRVNPALNSGPLTANGSNQVRWLTNWLGQMERALYASDWTARTGTNHYSHYLDPDSFIDYHWIVEFSKQIDGYRLSNFMTKDRNGRLKMEPIWDWNLSFGNADYLDGGHTNRWYYEDTSELDHPWLRRLICGTTSSTGSSGDPEFTQKLADRWSVLRTNILNGPRVVTRIDELSIMLSNAANRNFQHYRILGSPPPGPSGIWACPAGALNHDGSAAPGRPWDVDFTTPTQYMGSPTSIIGYLKRWVLGRYLWIDSQFTPPPTLSSAGGLVGSGFTLTLSGPPGATLYYRTDGLDPRGVGGAVNGTTYTAPIQINGNVRVVARARRAGSWKNTWSGPAAATFYTATPALRITEIMYHPAPPPAGSTNSAEDFQYIEVKNVGGTALNVNRFSLSEGVVFQFPNATLQPGQSAVIVKHLAAFQSRYGAGLLVLGVFSGDLNNAGERLVLRGAAQEPILDFSYADDWYPATDGGGFALAAQNEGGSPASWGLAGSWRASSTRDGSPGTNDPPPPARPAILVNEALTHTDPPSADAVELFNPTTSPVNIGGWFLSDDFDNPKKFVIPQNTIMPPAGFVVFHETNSFNFQPDAPGSFALGSDGDAIWLFSGDGQNLTGYAHGFRFGAAPNGLGFGRHVTSTGEEQFVIQSGNTLGSANAGPLVGPIIISEIHYHPPNVNVGGILYANTLDEFVEVRNVSATDVSLFDPAAPTNTWRLRDAVDFVFPTNVHLLPGASLLVVSFNPTADPAAATAFRARHAVPTQTPLFGPWAGLLANDRDSVELIRPDAPELNQPTPYILADRVEYSDQAPWPVAADGLGQSLQRRTLAAYGNDPNSWLANAPTPGDSVSVIPPPAFVVHPLSQTALEGGSVTFSTIVTGTPPFSFRWRRGGTDLVSGVVYSNSTLGYAAITLTNLLFSSGAPDYHVVASTLVAGGSPSAASSNAVLTVLGDADRDGIPDVLEPLDGAADDDHDGMSNAAEYFAGTDPNNPNSYLRLSISPSVGATLSFMAVSNRTYSVQYTAGLNPVLWRKLGDVLARPVTRQEVVVDPEGSSNRWYRLVVPLQR